MVAWETSTSMVMVMPSWSFRMVLLAPMIWLLLTVTVTFTQGFDMDKYVSNFTASDFIVADAGKFQNSVLDFTTDMAVPQTVIDDINAQGGITDGGAIYGQTFGALEYVTEDWFRQNKERFYTPEQMDNLIRLTERNEEGLLADRIQLSGMSDFAHWQTEWRDQVFSKMAENPQHQYLFLTKRPEDIVFSTLLDNAWFGVTVTSSREKGRIQTLREHIRGGHYHVTFEPMFDNIGTVDLTGIEWIVIGTETGRRKGKAVSKPEWVWNLTHQAHALGTPVFMKEDLLPIIGEESMTQELPPAFCRVLEEQKAWRK